MLINLVLYNNRRIHTPIRTSVHTHALHWSVVIKWINIYNKEDTSILFTIFFTFLILTGNRKTAKKKKIENTNQTQKIIKIETKKKQNAKWKQHKIK